MDVFGELVSAQYENLTLDPTGFMGRTYFNTVTGKVRVYNGTNWADVSTPLAPAIVIARTLTENVTVNADSGRLFVGPIVPNGLSVNVFGGSPGGYVAVYGPLTIQPGGTVTVQPGGTMKVL